MSENKRCLHERSEMTQAEKEVELKEEDFFMADLVFVRGHRRNAPLSQFFSFLREVLPFV